MDLLVSCVKNVWARCLRVILGSALKAQVRLGLKKIGLASPLLVEHRAKTRFSSSLISQALDNNLNSPQSHSIANRQIMLSTHPILFKGFRS